jgi:hypothetical protein
MSTSAKFNLHGDDLASYYSEMSTDLHVLLQNPCDSEQEWSHIESNSVITS